MAERIVKVIPPTIEKIRAERKTRAAAYCRVSTDSEDQANSFAAQLKYYTDFIRGNTDMEFVDIYADEGISGTCVNKRDEFKRMMKDAANGRIDRIFVKSVSRFARNSLECIEAIRRLATYGTTVLFENDNIDTKTMNSELILYVKSAFAQMESMSGSKRVSTAVRMCMENGESFFTHEPYGYEFDEKGGLRIIPEQAEVVRRIFALYLAGNGSNRIVEILNDEGIPASNGRWNLPGIRYILTNEKYIGDTLHQKTYTPQIFPLRNRPNYGAVDQFYVENTHEAIISREVFEAAQKRLHRNTSKPKHEKPRRVFDKMVFCEECGWSYKARTLRDVRYWVCSRKSEACHSCGGKNVREDEIKEAFVEVYNKLRFFEKEILDKTLSQLLGVREKMSGQNNEITQIDAEIAKLCGQNNMYAQLHGQGVIDEVSYLERTTELKFKITELRNKRLKLLNADEDEMLIENLRILKEILTESPKTILHFDPQLFLTVTEKVLVGNDGTVVFQFKGGLQLRQRLSEVL